MSAFRFVNQAPQFFLNSGLPNANGFLYSYETDLTTLKTTWSDEAKTTPNTNPILLDSAGRTVTDVWLDGEYGIVLQAASGSTIWTRNNVQSGADPGFVIPALVNQSFLSNNGIALQWVSLLNKLIPDMTGFADAILSTDGQQPVWIPQASLNIPTITVTGNSVKIGDVLFQFGIDSVPAATVSPFHSNSKVITFPIAYDTCFGCWAIGQNASIAANGYAGIFTSTSTPTGSTIAYNTNEANTDSSTWVTSAVPFSWLSVGVKA